MTGLGLGEKKDHDLSRPLRKKEESQRKSRFQVTKEVKARG